MTVSDRAKKDQPWSCSARDQSVQVRRFMLSRAQCLQHQPSVSSFVVCLTTLGCQVVLELDERAGGGNRAVGATHSATRLHAAISDAPVAMLQIFALPHNKHLKQRD
jgi:hypothetical protein